MFKTGLLAPDAFLHAGIEQADVPELDRWRTAMAHTAAHTDNIPQASMLENFKQTMSLLSRRLILSRQISALCQVPAYTLPREELDARINDLREEMRKL
jgi:hypothetical protein